MSETDAKLEQVQRQIADLSAALARARVLPAAGRKARKKGRTVLPSPPKPPGPEPTDLDVRRARALLRRNGWHEHG